MEMTVCKKCEQAIRCLNSHGALTCEKHQQERLLREYTKYLMDRNFCDDDVVLECDAVADFISEAKR